MTQTNNQVPRSNKVFFVGSIIVALLAIAAVLFFVVKNDPYKGIDAVVLEENPDPTLVFDAPFTKANLSYIDLEKYSSDTTHAQAIGCGDGILSYEIPIGESFGAIKTDALTFVIAQLLDTAVFENYKASDMAKKHNPYHALSSSTLTIKKITELPGQYEVRLAGKVVQSGVCDGPRIQAQLQKTIEQVVAPATVSIYINDIPLAEAFSQQ